MGIVNTLLKVLFGGGRNAVAETLEIFAENKESAGQRQAAYRAAALGQFAAEFAFERKGWFDRFMDGLNRLPRPAMALGTIGLFATAMIDPLWFAARMQGVALVPEPMWWLMGAIVSFYFGARYQTKSQVFQNSIARTLANAGDVTRNIAGLKNLAQEGHADFAEAAHDENAALLDWRNAK